MSVNPEDCRRSVWAEWAERKKTNEPILLGDFRKTCAYCAHCDWIKVGKTNEFFCHRLINGERVTVDMTGRTPEECKKFELRRKYAKNES